MAAQLKVEELRAELAQRGLSIAGKKPTLVSPLSLSLLNLTSSFSLFNSHFHPFSVLQIRRLESALREENQQSKDGITECSSSSVKKRERDSECGDGSSEKIAALEKFRDMTVQQLRKEAILRGISAVGTKRELVDRICEDAVNKSEDPLNGMLLLGW